MICFVFSALIVALDQFFKYWVVRTIDLPVGGLQEGPVIIPGILGLTRLENDGAMLNILSGQQWLLSGIALVASIALIMIILRYNEGFWGTLGLASVLGGTLGNLMDRIFNDGKVIDMFRTLFINFPIFNIADMFITLGFFTFLVHFIFITLNSTEKEGIEAVEASENTDHEHGEVAYDDFKDIEANISATVEQEIADFQSAPINEPDSYSYKQTTVAPEPIVENDVMEYSPETDEYIPAEEYEPVVDYEPTVDAVPEISFTMEALEAEIGSLDDDYDLEDVLREYGIDKDDL